MGFSGICELNREAILRLHMNVLERVPGFHQVLQGVLSRSKRTPTWSAICNFTANQKGLENLLERPVKQKCRFQTYTDRGSNPGSSILCVPLSKLLKIFDPSKWEFLQTHFLATTVQTERAKPLASTPKLWLLTTPSAPRGRLLPCLGYKARNDGNDSNCLLKRRKCMRR